MKLFLTSIIIFSFHLLLYSQTYEAEISGQGITFPIIDTWQRSMLTPANGQCIFNPDTKSIECYSGIPGNSEWIRFQPINESSDRSTYFGDGADGALSGRGNTSFGWSAEGPRSGDYNTSIGFRAGDDAFEGNYNIFIGPDAGNESKGDNNVFIGSSAGGHEFISNTLIIENGTTTNENALIYGDFEEDYLTINGTLNISEVLRLKALDAAPVCDGDSFGSLYMDQQTERLNLCTSTGWKAMSIEP